MTWQNFLDTICKRDHFHEGYFPRNDGSGCLYQKIRTELRSGADWEEGVFITNLPIRLSTLLTDCGLTESNGEAKRLIKQSGIKVIRALLPLGFVKNENDWNVINNPDFIIDKLPITGMVVMKGKRSEFVWVQEK
jgi:hypothetical protein